MSQPSTENTTPTTSVTPDTPATPDSTNNSIELIDMTVLSKSLENLNNALNTATKNGAYDLDGAFNTKISFNNVIKSCQALEKLQNLLIKLQGENQPEATPTPSSSLDTSFTEPKIIVVPATDTELVV